MRGFNNDKNIRGSKTVLLKLEYIYVLIIALMLGACTTTPTEESTRSSYPSSTPNNNTYSKNYPVPSEESTGKKTFNQDSRERDRKNISHNDVWKRIQENLLLQRHLSQARVQDKLAFYSSKQDYLDRVADRARPYIFHIVEELEKRNMPLDLALLPIVESAYQPFAYSRSHASGIWQFIPGTGRHYGLKQTWWYDGRRDILASTDAALTYLQKLHDYFNGDWLLAVAAYNAGERTIERAIENNIKSGKPADFWSLKLRRETMHYVPSLLAVAEIVAQPEKYHISLKPISNTPYFAVVDAGSQIDLSIVSELTGMTTDDLHILNPGIKKWATDPEGPHHLLIPLHKSESFQQKLAALPASERVKWQVHHIKQGDTLGRIASLYRTDISALKQANKLNGNLIRAGRTLLIPTSYKPTVNGDNKHYKPGNGQALVARQERTTDSPLQYTILRGDSLWNISRRFGVDIDDLCRWNGIQRNSIITAGETLLIYAQNNGQLLPAVAEKSTVENRRISYTVQSGDSLWQIARRFDVTVEQIQHWNSMNQQTSLKPGQNLDIYIGQPPADV